MAVLGAHGAMGDHIPKGCDVQFFQHLLLGTPHAWDGVGGAFEEREKAIKG